MNIDASRILTRKEIAACVAELRRRGKRSVQRLQDLILFRLSCCCGLRQIEISGLQVGDIVTSGDRPTVRVRKETTKGRANKRRGRLVPLWWDKGTLDDIRAWKELRLAEGAEKESPLLIVRRGVTKGRALPTRLIRKRWYTLLRDSLGHERATQLSCHCGRHTFVSFAVFVRKNLPAARDAAGHADVKMTDRYTHVLEEAESQMPDMFPIPEKKKKGSE